MRLFLLFLAFFGLAANAFSSNAIGELDSFPRVLLAGNGRHTTTLRYYDTRLATLSPGGKYTAFLCQNNRVEIVTLAGDMIVVRVTTRPNKATRCTLTIADNATGNFVYRWDDPLVPFAPFNPQPGALQEVANDVVPSFYFADRKKDLTRVYVNGQGLTEVTRVTVDSSINGCTFVEKTATGFSCLLPIIEKSGYDPIGALRLTAYTPRGISRFYVEGLRDFDLQVESVSTPKVSAGSSLVMRMSQAVTKARRLPWVPVLINVRSGAVMSKVRVMNLKWTANQVLSANIYCDSCADGDYYVALGEAIPGLAAPVVKSRIKISYSSRPKK
jgi:hypothetical protein